MSEVNQIQISEFINRFTHDIFSSARTISSFSQILNEAKENLSDKQVKSIEFINGGALNLKEQITNLKSYLKVINAIMQVEEINVTAMVDKYRINNSERLIKEQLHLEVEDGIFMCADEVLMQQLIRLLFDNVINESGTSQVLNIEQFKEKEFSGFKITSTSNLRNVEKLKELMHLYQKQSNDLNYNEFDPWLVLVDLIIKKHHGKIDVTYHHNLSLTITYPNKK